MMAKPSADLASWFPSSKNHGGALFLSTAAASVLVIEADVTPG